MFHKTKNIKYSSFMFFVIFCILILQHYASIKLSYLRNPFQLSEQLKFEIPAENAVSSQALSKLSEDAIRNTYLMKFNRSTNIYYYAINSWSEKLVNFDDQQIDNNPESISNDSSIISNDLSIKRYGLEPFRFVYLNNYPEKDVSGKFTVFCSEIENCEALVHKIALYFSLDINDLAISTYNEYYDSFEKEIVYFGIIALIVFIFGLNVDMQTRSKTYAVKKLLGTSNRKIVASEMLHYVYYSVTSFTVILLLMTVYFGYIDFVFLRFTLVWVLSLITGSAIVLLIFLNVILKKFSTSSILKHQLVFQEMIFVNLIIKMIAMTFLFSSLFTIANRLDLYKQIKDNIAQFDSAANEYYQILVQSKDDPHFLLEVYDRLMRDSEVVYADFSEYRCEYYSKIDADYNCLFPSNKVAIVNRNYLKAIGSNLLNDPTIEQRDNLLFVPNGVDINEDSLKHDLETYYFDGIPLNYYQLKYDGGTFFSIDPTIYELEYKITDPIFFVFSETDEKSKLALIRDIGLTRNSPIKIIIPNNQVNMWIEKNLTLLEDFGIAYLRQENITQALTPLLDELFAVENLVVADIVHGSSALLFALVLISSSIRNYLKMEQRSILVKKFLGFSDFKIHCSVFLYFTVMNLLALLMALLSTNKPSSMLANQNLNEVTIWLSIFALIEVMEGFALCRSSRSIREEMLSGLKGDML